MAASKGITRPQARPIRGLVGRLVFFSVGGLVALSVVAALLLVEAQRRAWDLAGLDAVAQEALLAAETARRHGFAADPQRVAGHLIDEAALNPSLAAGEVIDAGGRRLARFSSEPAPQGPAIEAAIMDSGRRLGAVRFWRAPAAPAPIRDLAGLAAVIFATAALAAAMLALAARRMLGPLGRLAERAGASRPNERIEIRTGDEIERLAEAFNHMTGRLEDSLRRAQHLALVDPVTDLPNKQRMHREIDAAIAQMREEGTGGALVVVLFDRLARTLEGLGREAGEDLVRAIAGRLGATAAAADAAVCVTASAERPALLARLSEHEFGLLVPSALEESEIERLVQMILAPFSRPFEHRDQRMTLAPYIGVVALPEDGRDADSALRRARMALAAARDAKEPTRFFTPALDHDAAARIQLEREMRLGVEANQFRAYFQPKVNLRTGQIVGAEALARWVRPDGEMIGPGRFIPLAEEMGLIGPIAEAIMRDACWKAASWAREGLRCGVAVNVSAIQLADNRFPALVRRTLDQAGLTPSLLELEITESVAMDDPARAMRLVEPLRAEGVRFAIDDFGTGHSSLAALTRLPFDVLKIDQSFVRCLANDKGAVSIIETILALAASLDFEAVAEGVETEAEAEFLRRRGCPTAQGYLYSKPVPPHEFLALLRAQASAQKVQEVG